MKRSIDGVVKSRKRQKTATLYKRFVGTVEQYEPLKPQHSVKCIECGRESGALRADWNVEKISILQTNGKYMDEQVFSWSCFDCSKPKNMGADRRDSKRVVYDFSARKWVRWNDFFLLSGQHGLYKVPRKPCYERIVLRLLCRYFSKLEQNNPCFHSTACRMPAKVLWVNGEPAGFYTYTLPGITYNVGYDYATSSLVPVLTKIYVRPKFRGNGYGKQMIRDFFLKVCKDKWEKHPFLGIEGPVETACVRTMTRVLSDEQLRRVRVMRAPGLYAENEERLAMMKTHLQKHGHSNFCNIKQLALYRILSQDNRGLLRKKEASPRGICLQGFQDLPTPEEGKNKSKKGMYFKIDFPKWPTKRERNWWEI